MDTAEAIHRAHVTLIIGLVMLGLTGAQFWTGKTPTPFARKPLQWTSREKDPTVFWIAVISWGGSGLYILGGSLSRLVRLHAAVF
jgi:hypothetical protein